MLFQGGTRHLNGFVTTSSMANCDKAAIDSKAESSLGVDKVFNRNNQWRLWAVRISLDGPLCRTQNLLLLDFGRGRRKDGTLVRHPKPSRYKSIDTSTSCRIMNVNRVNCGNGEMTTYGVSICD